MVPLFWCSLFLAVTGAVYYAFAPEIGIWPAPNEFTAGLAAFVAGTVSVVGLRPFIDWDALDREPRHGLEIWENRIVIDPELDKIEIQLSDISRIEFERSEEGVSYWAIDMAGTDHQLTAYPFSAMEKACAQVMLRFEQRPGFF